MTTLDIRQIQASSDNYIYLLRDAQEGAVAVVDPTYAAPVIQELERLGWTLTHILNTHHHADHTGGNLELKQRYGAEVIGARIDEARLPGLDRPVGENDIVRLGASGANVLELPGHTRGHVAYWFSDADCVFCGDTLFALGCGRMFEGSPAQMWDSLCKLRSLPLETKVYCAHEYTQNNARFALSVDPDNDDLKRRAQWIDEMRAAGRPTVPSTLGQEIRSNPFLRADDPALAAQLGMKGENPVAVFAELRKRKDRF